MAASTTLTRVAPILDWLPRYPRDDLSHDLRAGLTVAILVIPQAMAYAALAGVPAITGLYSAMVAMTVYAVLGTSRFISVGPVAIDSLLPAAPVFGSRAPNTTRPTRACMIAPAHMAQGSRVTYRVLPGKR